MRMVVDTSTTAFSNWPLSVRQSFAVVTQSITNPLKSPVLVSIERMVLSFVIESNFILLQTSPERVAPSLVLEVVVYSCKALVVDSRSPPQSFPIHFRTVQTLKPSAL